jgi:UDP-2,3-diacylglucosamine pyrophosphatase LpxH
MGWLAPKFSPESNLMKTFLWTAGAGNDLPSSEGKKANTQEKRSRFAKDAEVVAAWDFERIIPAHGDEVNTDAKRKFLTAFSRVSRILSQWSYEAQC